MSEISGDPNLHSMLNYISLQYLVRTVMQSLLDMMSQYKLEAKHVSSVAILYLCIFRRGGIKC